MFFVYYGYVGPDNYDASEGPIYKLTACATEQEVIELKKELDAEFDPSTDSNVIFKVIEGEERTLKPEQVIVDYKLV